LCRQLTVSSASAENIFQTPSGWTATASVPGVVELLQHRGYCKGLFEFHGGERPRGFNMHFNRRSEVWGLMRDWFHNGSAEIPDDPELAVHLTGPEYGFSSKNQTQLERKEDMKRRGLASPDLGDCLSMTFAVDMHSAASEPHS